MPKQAKSQWVKCISQSGVLRSVGIEATSVVQEIITKHNYQTPELKRAIAEAVIGGLILSSYGKNQDRINLNIKGTGMVRQAFVDATAEGVVRAYVYEQTVHTELSEGQGPWGEGYLSVLRAKSEEKENPYTGLVPLLTGFLAKDLAYYWVQSEQVDSACGIEIFQDAKGNITLAEGFLIQALPGASSDDVLRIEMKLRAIQTYKENAEERQSSLGLMSIILSDEAFHVLEEKELRFECSCSLARVEQALMLVDHSELEKDDPFGETQVTCDFCGEKYSVSNQKLLAKS